LENRCKAAEEETVRLRQELELARAGAPLSSMFTPQAVEASSELLKQLSAASASLSKFQQIAFPDTMAQTQFPSLLATTQLHPLRPAAFPSPEPSSYSALPILSNSHHSPHRNSHKQSLQDESHPHSSIGEPPFSCETTSRSPSLLSDCCGGFVDCGESEEEHNELSEEDYLSPSSTSLLRTSGLRSTSDGIPSTNRD